MNPIAQIVVGLPIDGPFDYALPSALRSSAAVGQRVSVVFNHQKRVGYLVGSKKKSLFKKLNPVLAILEKNPSLSAQALALTKKISEEGGSSWGEAIETYLPYQLRKNRPWEDNEPVPEPILSNKKPEITLLHDVTRTQSWPLLIEAMNKALNEERGVLFLVPEVHSIEDVKEQCEGKINAPIVVHNRKRNPTQEWEEWKRVRQGEVKVLLGTRSSIFAPLPSLGLIVVYEEENSAYKQEQVPHYHTRDAALWRAQIEGCDVIFVSSAPSAEIWHLAQRKKIKRVSLPGEPAAVVQVIDMRDYNPRRHSILSFPLQSALQKVLEQKGKAVLYFNRKGFSRVTRCNQCGFTLNCPRCDIALKYEFAKKVLACSRCNHEMPLPKICPSCNGAYLRSVGTGIEKLESEVARFFPQARTARYEKETKTPPQADILIATQALWRLEGHWPADLITVMNFDNELNHADFRGANRALSLLVHLRLWAKQKLMVQTTMPDNECIKTVKTFNFVSFYRQELKARKDVGLPPYLRLATLTLRGPDESVLQEQSEELYKLLKSAAPSRVDISEPFSEGAAKLRDKYRLTIMLKGRKKEVLLALAKQTLKKVRRKKGTVVALDGNP